MDQGNKKAGKDLELFPGLHINSEPVGNDNIIYQSAVYKGTQEEKIEQWEIIKIMRMMERSKPYLRPFMN
jgi:hypothetical protein